MALADLKPCPFCGGEADMIEVRETEDHFTVKKIECYCTRCGAKAPGYYLNGICEYGDKKTCVEAAKIAWNRRIQEE